MDAYVDSIKQYQVHVDSLVFSYSSNPASFIRHGVIHYNCIDSKGEDKGYGSGGSADIYYESRSKKVLKIAYMKGCDTIMVERTVYFIDNKIVLAVIHDKGKHTTSYFQNDRYLSIDNSEMTTEKFANELLKEGYEILKDFN